MSKIKIVGHASGSGVLTIAAPNTNTDRTITIPDVTGTLLDSGSDLPAANLTGTIVSARLPAANQTAKLPLAGGTMTGTIAGFTSTGIDDNADALAITIDSLENIGIRETAPRADLHLKASVNDWEGGLLIEHDNATTGWNIHPERTDNALLFGFNSDTSVALTSQGATVRFKINQDGAVHATSFTGDGSALTGVDAATVATSAPSSPAQGDFWFNSTTGQKLMNVYNGTDWDVLSNVVGSATGGTITTPSGYKVHTFTSSSNFVITGASITVDYLIIGGGGSGGTDYGGGGGAGGFVYQTSQTLATGTHAVVVGAGAAGTTFGPTHGATGSDSTFNSLTAAGGGGGGAESANFSGTAGGSGGGSSYGSGGASGGASNQASYSGTGFGNAGGTCSSAGPYYSCTGGGGAGGAGESFSSRVASGYGGAGKANSISGSSVTYAGGGGGGFAHDNGGVGGAGGSGGGGAGGTSQNGSGAAGSANTGSGGGGAGGSSSSAQGGAGGSGIVIVRYAV